MQYLSKDILIIALGSIFVLLISSFIIIFIVIYQQRQQKYMKEKEDMKFLFQQELLKTQLEIQEATFKNISQEIHDNIGQALSFIKLNINTVDIKNPNQAQEKLSTSKTLLTKAIQDLRDLSKSLNTDFIADIGLPTAIEQQLNLLQKTGLYNTSILIQGEVCKYAIQKELVLFRIVQELLNNIVKHAEANKIDITVDYKTDSLCINITDNGKGFDISTLQLSQQRTKGIGLYNMINRIALIDGTIQFKAGAGNGTLVTLQLTKQTAK